MRLASVQSTMPGTDRPRITLKIAQTLDGRVAATGGHSRWVTGPESLRESHSMRSTHDAILVGVGTVIADDPHLTVRLVEGGSPLRVILDSHLRTLSSSHVLRESPETTMLVASHGVSPSEIARVRTQGAQVLVLPRNRDGIELRALLTELAGRGIGTLLVEGGPRVITSFLRARLADEITVFIAPKFIGHGMEAVGDLGISQMDDAIRLRDVTIRPSGDDWIAQGTPVWPSHVRLEGVNLALEDDPAVS